MKPSISVRPEAQVDIKEVALWYEDRLTGLGIRFRDELRTTLGHIADNPLRFPVIEDVRRALLHRFPYAVYFSVEGENMVLSTARDPAKCQRRS